MYQLNLAVKHRKTWVTNLKILSLSNAHDMSFIILAKGEGGGGGEKERAKCKIAWAFVPSQSMTLALGHIVNWKNKGVMKLQLSQANRKSSDQNNAVCLVSIIAKLTPCQQLPAVIYGVIW